jgi:hypothetical protein
MAENGESSMTITTTPIDNGVDVDALLGARAAFAETPEIAQFQWRSSVTWENGTHSRSEVESFYGFADEQAHHQSFTLDADHPLQFASQDKGPTPVEYILVGLGGLSHRGRGRRGPAAADPAAVRQGHAVGRHGPARHPGADPDGPQRLQRASRWTTRSRPTPPPTRSGRSSAQSQKRSGRLRHRDQPDRRHRHRRLRVV